MGSALLVLLLAQARASIRFSKTLTSHAVLQRAPSPALLWGWTEPGATVTLRVDGAVAGAAVADASGAWEVAVLGDPGPPVNISASAAGAEAALDDVLFGDVWLCAGQSNMGVAVEYLDGLVDWNGTVNNGTAEAELWSEYPLVRLARQATASNATPVDDPAASAGWRAPTYAGVNSFSANQVGGTAVERWSSSDARKPCTAYAKTPLATCGGGGGWLDDYAEDVPSAASDDVAVGFPSVESDLYNGMIHPWRKYRATGAIWYQGESNVACNDRWAYKPGNNCGLNASACADFYACQFPAMIADWRAKFNNPDLTFLFVQLPPYVENLPSTASSGAVDDSLPLTRLAQAAALALPRTAMATAVDHGDLAAPLGSIHPRDKVVVAERLVAAALGAVPPSGGPTVAGVARDGDKLVVNFENVRGVLTVRGYGGAAPFNACPVDETQAPNVEPRAAVPRTQCASFEVFAGGAWRNVTRVAAANATAVALAGVPATASRLRYLHADWPVPIVYDSAGDILTGRYFHNVRVSDFRGAGCMHVDSRNPKFYAEWHVATHFRDLGYSVGYFGKHLNTDNPLAAPPGVDRWVANGGGTYLDPSFAVDGVEVAFDDCAGRPCYSTSIIGNKTVDWLRGDFGKPFVAVAAVKAPHVEDGPGWPVAVPAPWYNSSALFAGEKPPRTPNWNASCPDHHWLVASQPPMTREQAHRSDELFRARLRSLLSVDDLVAGVVDALEASQRLDDTFVVFTSDHGFRFGQFRMPEGKWNAYENDLRVPFWIRGPGVKPGGVLTFPATHVDLAPTLLGFAGARATPATMDGLDLSAAILGKETADRATLLLEYVGAGTVVRYEHAEDATNNTFRALRILDGTRDLKYVEFTSSQQNWNWTAPADEHELFDLAADPYEMTNLYATAAPELKRELRGEVERRYRCRGPAECG
ncbi:sulfuric ester hydrolase [Aureococcus anophagefferens]|uniref:Sulfuric ester hydrolase n=1 Tax=Aureococcus anophagefferens TaxID=44056 RepID=A0ABR1G176_AURAN